MSPQHLVVVIVGVVVVVVAGVVVGNIRNSKAAIRPALKNIPEVLILLLTPILIYICMSNAICHVCHICHI